MPNEVHFVGSFPSLAKVPANSFPQFAFVGRSNVGKSSLINMLTGRKSIAKVSKQPGKTQMINLFDIDGSWSLVDLPGYGYAKESKKKRERWELMVRNYLKHAQHLQTAFVLLDSNIPPQKIDIEFVNWMGEHAIPFCIIFTKVDKSKRQKLGRNIKAIQDALLIFWEELPPQFKVSSVTTEGRDELLSFIEEVRNQSLEH